MLATAALALLLAGAYAGLAWQTSAGERACQTANASSRSFAARRRKQRFRQHHQYSGRFSKERHGSCGRRSFRKRLKCRNQQRRKHGKQAGAQHEQPPKRQHRQLKQRQQGSRSTCLRLPPKQILTPPHLHERRQTVQNVRVGARQRLLVLVQQQPVRIRKLLALRQWLVVSLRCRRRHANGHLRHVRRLTLALELVRRHDHGKQRLGSQRGPLVLGGPQREAVHRLEMEQRLVLARQEEQAPHGTGWEKAEAGTL